MGTDLGKHRDVIHNRHHLRTVVVAAAATSFAFGAASAASATTEPPTDSAPVGTEAPPAGGSAPSDVSAFCEAELAAEAAFFSGDPAAIGPAAEALVAAAPEEIAPTVQEVLATAENTDSPEFAEAYSALIDYLRANCGFGELDVAGSEYEFSGIPEEVPAGATIVTFENVGEEAHEFIVFRINDDVTMPVEEIFALPQEEAEAMLTEVGATFALPGGTGHTVFELAPGRHVALCFVPQGTTAEVIEEMMAAEAAAAASSLPADTGVADSASMGTEPHEMTADTAAADTASADTAAMDSVPVDGSAPAGSAPPGEGPPHFMLGMIQEFQVV
jgi:hypothetical protein